MEALLQFAGRLHVMLLHAPIGLLIGLAMLELFMLVRGRAIPREVRALLAWLVALAAAASVGTGLLLREEGGHDTATMDLHQWLGIASGVGALLAAIVQQVGKLRAYGAVLALTCGLIVPTGHFGASMTHGDDFLTEPFSPKTPPVALQEDPKPAEVAAPRTVYASTIAPIFEKTCLSCHGPKRQKGDLRLDSPEAIMAGGGSGPVIVAGDGAGSELLRRMKLELDDEDHMPPKAKFQPDQTQIKAVEQWIAAGASFTALANAAPSDGEASSQARAPGSEVRDPGTSNAAPEVRNSGPGTGNPNPVTRASSPPPHASAESLAAIRAIFVHVEPVSRDSTLLVIDASAVARDIDDAAAKALLEPVLEQTSDLTLARTKVTDSTMSLIAKMPRLRRLNVSSTAVTDAGIALLASHPMLEELIVSGCKLSDQSLESIAKIPTLRRVYVWKSGISGDAVASLRTKREGLVVDAGDTAPALALEKDAPFKPVAVTPQPGANGTPASDPAAEASAIAAAKAEALRPVNTMCPVSGKAVDADFAIVYKGRVVGFCCRHCLGQFLEEPSKFEASIK